jgi:hypothetical protein
MTFQSGPHAVAGLSVPDLTALIRQVQSQEAAAVTPLFASDSNRLLAAEQLSIAQAARILEGTIHQTFPGLFLYRVIVDHFEGEILCTDSTGFLAGTTAVSHVHPVGTRVIVLRERNTFYGTILALTPPSYILDTLDGKEKQGGKFDRFLSGLCQFHATVRPYLRRILESKTLSEHFPQYTHGRAADACERDYSILNMSGGGFHTDPFQTFIRQSHSCGMWAFSMDQLLRLIGRSVQVYSAIHETYFGLDEIEAYGFTGIALYPYEGLGLFTPNGTLHKRHDALAAVSSKGKGFYEPENPDAVPFYRLQKYSGSLGQGQVALMFLPPQSRPEVYTMTDSNHPITVARQQLLLDGTMLFESAKGIHLIKHGNIKAYKRIRTIEDPAGEDSYKGTFTAPKMPEPLPPDAAITDQIIHAIREQANVGFESHKLDFEPIPEEQQPFIHDQNPGELSALKTSAEIPEAVTRKLFVSGQHGEVEYSGSMASISLLSNGGIAIRGGKGEEILLQGGNITFSAPGDLRCLFGRSAVVLAGDDVVLRAKNSVDVTATDNDVRLKAERNLDMAGGMSGKGRTLLENKASGSPNLEGVQGREGEDIHGTGLILRATDSVIASYGRGIYTRSLNGGEIFIDADNGEGSVKARARYVGINAQSNVVLGAGAGSNLLQVNRGSTLMTERLEVEGQILSSKNVLADLGCNQLPIDPPNFDDEKLKSIDDSRETFNESNIHRPDERYYDDAGLGSEEMIKANTFSYRNSEQCGAGRFSFDEPYWMELYGQTIVVSLATWQEPVYAYQETINQTAWPGHEKWVNDACVLPHPLQFSAEENTDPSEPSAVTPEEFYRVIDPT